MRFIKPFLSTILFSFLILSCQQEEVSPINTESSPEGRLDPPTTCNITGPSVVEPGTSESYSYSSNFTESSYTWSVTSGAITITSGQGTGNATVSFGSNFTSGRLCANASNGSDLSCQACIDIDACDEPTGVSITQDYTVGGCEGEVFRFDAAVSGTTAGGSYSWSVGNGASITSGQGTSTIYVQSPSSGGFTIQVTHTSNCNNAQVSAFTLAEFDAGC